MKQPRKGWWKRDRDRQGCGRVVVQEGIKLPVTSQPGKESEEFDRGLRTQRWHRALKRESYSTKDTVSSKQGRAVLGWFFFFRFSCGT